MFMIKFKFMIISFIVCMFVEVLQSKLFVRKNAYLCIFIFRIQVRNPKLECNFDHGCHFQLVCFDFQDKIIIWRVRDLSASLCCVLEQDIFILA